MPTGPMAMGPQTVSGPRGPMGSGSLGMGAMNNSLMPGGMGVSGASSLPRPLDIAVHAKQSGRVFFSASFFTPWLGCSVLCLGHEKRCTALGVIHACSYRNRDTCSKHPPRACTSPWGPHDPPKRANDSFIL